MDLDVDVRAQRHVLRAISETLSSRWLLERLRGQGIEGVVYGGRPAKRTDTTLRFKLAVVNKGGIRLPTRIEASLRERFPGDAVVTESPDPAVIGRYVDVSASRLAIPHYPRDPAMRQKLSALASRSAPQARDVFDVHVIAGGDVRTVDLALLKSTLSKQDLDEASRRAVSVTYRQFQDQVLEFLPDAERVALSEAEWERRQQFVVDLIETVLRS